MFANGSIAKVIDLQDNSVLQYCKRGINCSIKYNGFKWGQKIPVVTITDWDEWNIALLSSI